jgi:hypothetical protein
MKLPRWAVVSMLAASSIAILAMPGWWWVWPERTAQEFVRRLATQDESWTQLVWPADTSQSGCIELVKKVPPTGVDDLEPQPRSITDAIFGRETYKTGGKYKWTFTAERGVISISATSVVEAVLLAGHNLEMQAIQSALEADTRRLLQERRERSL